MNGAADTLAPYARRQAIHTRAVNGHYQHLRLAIGAVLLGGFYLMPWLNWNGRQSILFDLGRRQFHILGLTFWPQDMWMLGWALMLAAFALFVSTTFIGRAWCGFVCPQTVWTAMFMAIERFVEGKRHQRIRLAAAPLSITKLRKRLTKHALWLALAAATGITFIGYFVPIRELIVDLPTGRAGLAATFWVAAFTGATYLGAGWLREQLCFYMCPYARFQSSMFDRDTLTVAYDARRGEPRKHLASDGARGDCIDCQMCVQVCPTGIDIRDGLQYGCIGCARCIDACDGVMDRIGAPRRLIGYFSERELEGGARRLLRPNVLVYTSAAAIMTLGLLGAIVLRAPFAIDVLRERGTLFHERGSEVSNDYEVRIMNKTEQGSEFVVRADSALPLAATSDTRIVAGPGEVVSMPLTLAAPRTAVAGRTPAVLRLELCRVADDRCVAETTTFLGPGS